MPDLSFSISQLYIIKDNPLARKRALINIILSSIVFFILFLRIFEINLFPFRIFVALPTFLLFIQILNLVLFRRQRIPSKKTTSRRHGSFSIYRISGYTSTIYLVEWALVILSYFSVAYLMLDSLSFDEKYSGMHVILVIITVLLLLPVLDIIFTNQNLKKKSKGAE